jgi:Raf kinase inhibitor-like YbhB/YbcL family protein
MALNDPFASRPAGAKLTVISTSFGDGDTIPAKYTSGRMGMPGGKDVSPQLSWSGAPEGTRSFAVTVFDPDAPTGSGWWHWAVVDIPADTTELPEGAGTPVGDRMPPGSVQLHNDGGTVGYIGPAPPAGHGVHHYHFTVHALDTDSLDLTPDATPSTLSFHISQHSLGRGSLIGTVEVMG